MTPFNVFRLKGIPVVPTVWNASDLTGGITLSGANLIASGGTSSAIRATKGKNSGKWQFEVVVTNRGSTDSLYIGMGTQATGVPPVAAPGQAGTGTATSYRANGTIWNVGSSGGSGATYTTGDVIGITCDFTGTPIFAAYKNGVFVFNIATGTLGAGDVFPWVGAVGSAAWILTLQPSALTFPVATFLSWD